MPDLLLELLSEEIPARMQAKAAEDLKKLVTDGLVEAGLVYEGAKAFATPRRLALTVHGVPVASAATREERKGPRVGAPEQALAGFLKSAGLASIDQATIQSDSKKGDFYIAIVEKPGRAAVDVIAELVPRIVRAFPWPKSMRWGAASATTASLRWVRPLQGIVATFGPETEEPEVIRFEIDGLMSGNVTRGHRFHAPDSFQVKRFDDYATKLEAARVVLDPERRKAMILADAKNLAIAHGLELVEDPGLLDEVAGLVEWPVVLMGSFDPAFLEVPAEVIRATIRANQKCFVLKEPTGRLAPKFLLVANLEAKDGGAAIIAGNERVIRARLSDAKYFWDTDRKALPDYATPELAGKPLDQRLAKLRALSIVFHEKLGTQGERVDRIMALAREIAPLVGADPDKAARAAELAKADLVTEVVGEFPEVQGLMGRTYAILQGEDADVAAAIEEHYKPVGPSDRVPTNPVSIAVALADKLDTLVGFWAIDEKPTGSKDPFALRRAALGVVRVVEENDIQVPLHYFVTLQLLATLYAPKTLSSSGKIAFFRDAISVSDMLGPYFLDHVERYDLMPRPGVQEHLANVRRIATDLLSFFHDRLKVMLRDQGARHDLVDAVLASGGPPTPTLPHEGRGGRSATPATAEPGQAPSAARVPSPLVGEGQGGGASGPLPNDDLLLVVRRVEALGHFLGTEDGKALLAGYKRAANILRIEEKKDGIAYDGAPDHGLIASAGAPEEKALANVLDVAARHAAEHVAKADFEGAMAALAAARPAVDAFFEKILVNDPDPAIRANRLRLLGRLRAATATVADFSKIEG